MPLPLQPSLPRLKRLQQNLKDRTRCLRRKEGTGILGVKKKEKVTYSKEQGELGLIRGYVFVGWETAAQEFNKYLWV